MSVKLPLKTIDLDGDQIKYRAEISHQTVSTLTFWERIRVLFGKPVVVDSEIYCMNGSVMVMGSQGNTKVPPFFKKKIGGEQLESAPEEVPSE